MTRSRGSAWDRLRGVVPPLGSRLLKICRALAREGERERRVSVGGQGVVVAEIGVGGYFAPTPTPAIRFTLLHTHRVLEVDTTPLVLDGKVAIVKGGGRPSQSCEPAGMGASVEELAPDGELNLVLASARAAHLGAPSQRGRRRGERNPLIIRWLPFFACFPKGETA